MQGENFVIIGGDKRQKHVGEYLEKQGGTVLFYGLYDWDDDWTHLKDVITPGSIIILPVPASKNGKTVFMPFSKRELPLSRLERFITPGNRVFGGMLPPEFSARLKEKNIEAFDYYNNSFISENAYLTAFGALKIILEHIDFALPLGKFAVTGYGRVGQEMAEVLKKLSCDVTVFARRDTALRSAALHGCKTAELYELSAQCEKFDVIINTVPSNIFNAEILKNIKSECKYIELASAPFGVNFAEAEKYSVSVIKAPGLPGKYTAKTAGELIGRKIVKFLEKEEDDE